MSAVFVAVAVAVAVEEAEGYGGLVLVEGLDAENLLVEELRFGEVFY